MSKLDTAVWLSWRDRAELEKKTAHKTDADLAAEVSDLVGYDVGRALVNHWFRGRREPTLREFIALCAALGADPGHVLLNVRISYKQLDSTSDAGQALIRRAPSPDYLRSAAKSLKYSKSAPRKPFARRKSRV